MAAFVYHLIWCHTSTLRIKETSSSKWKLKLFAVAVSVRRRRKLWWFQVVALHGTAKKCTKLLNARAELLFCPLVLLSFHVLVAVAVVVCLRSLVLSHDWKWVNNRYKLESCIVRNLENYNKEVLNTKKSRKCNEII